MLFIIYLFIFRIPFHVCWGLNSVELGLQILYQMNDPQPVFLCSEDINADVLLLTNLWSVFLFVCFFNSLISLISLLILVVHVLDKHKF